MMGVDGMNNADIFDEYFDDEKPKYIIWNCPAFVLMRTATSGTYFNMCGDAKGHIKCADCTDCVMKRIVELAKGYKEELIDRKTKKVVATRYFPLAKEILQKLEIEECEDE